MEGRSVSDSYYKSLIIDGTVMGVGSYSFCGRYNFVNINSVTLRVASCL